MATIILYDEPRWWPAVLRINKTIDNAREEKRAEQSQDRAMSTGKR